MAANYQKKFEKDYQDLSERYDILVDKYDTVLVENRILKQEITCLKDNIQTIIDTAVSKAVAPLLAEIFELKEENTKLKNEITRLKNQINKDSSNSGKPPSANGFKKVVQNNREKSYKQSGGQKGHKGATLTAFDNPDKVITHKKDICECGGNICTTKSRIKQEVNLKIITEVTDHVFNDGVCEACGKIHKEPIPKNLSNPVNYGTTIKGLITILGSKGIVAMERSKELLELLTNGKLTVSTGTVFNWGKELAEKLKPVMDNIKEKLLNAEVIHQDESPIKVNGKLMYVHNTSTDKYTYQVAHPKRGLEAINDIGLLTIFIGTIVSDHFIAYYRYGNRNAECIAHILRYLLEIISIAKHKWAQKFKDFFNNLNSKKKSLIEKGINQFSDLEILKIKRKYDLLIHLGRHEYNNSNFKESAVIKLLNRLAKYKDNTLMFAEDFVVPFTNNQAERDLRGIKTKQKIGKFRSLEGAEIYSTIKSVESTYRKQGVNFLEAIHSAFNNQPLLI